MTDAPPGSLAHLALEALPYGVAVLDGDRVVLSTNRRWRRRREDGVPAHPPVGDRFPGDGFVALREDVEAVLAGERDACSTQLGEGSVAVHARGFTRGPYRHAVVASQRDDSEDWPLSAERLVDAIGDSIFVHDVEAGRVYVNETAARTQGLDDQALDVDTSAMRRVRERVSDESLAAYDEAVADVVDGADERRIEVEVITERGPLVVEALLTPLLVDGQRRGAVSVARDVTRYRRELRELAQRRDAREALYRITAIVQDLIGGLVGESRREDIEAAVVEELHRSELYRFAFVGRHHPDRDDLLELSTAGIDPGAAADLGRALLSEHAALLRTGEVRVVGLGSDLPPALGSDVLVVPLTYGRSVYGLLCVGLGRGELTERELSAFEVLGDVVGFAINAAKHRRLVQADLVTELEFRVDGGAGLLAGLSARLDCTLTVESVVPRDEGSQLQYVSVDGADAEALVATARDADGVAAARVVETDPGRVELTVDGGSALLALGQQGATVEDATADEDTARVTAAIAADENARAAVEAVRAMVPEAELVGKRDVERSPATKPAFDAATVGALTERQLAALETAYRAGYFESPRESTAQEVADALDITSPTLHQHLQAAHRKLLAGLFDDS